MKKPDRHEWLVIAEGNTDIAVYKEYLKDCISFDMISTGGKNRTLNMNGWDAKHINVLRHNLGRTGFKGLILVVDSDDNSASLFENYRRHDDSSLYVGNKPIPAMDATSLFWVLDNIKGIKTLPVKGIKVPRGDAGCLETDLLSAYGFPIRSQPEHNLFVNIIKQATGVWNIQNKKDGNPWWKTNEDAKMDKFMYLALKQGFAANRVEIPAPLKEPDVIRNMRMAMSDTTV